jgi:hypothetical protein
MKPLHTYLRTGALVAGLFGATALPVLAEAAPADATTTYGSGAAVQTKLQEAWITGSGDSITYTGTTSLAGEEEFGLNNSTLNLTKDPTADAVSPSQLDGYIGVDSPITETQRGNADTAAGTGTQNLLSIPVAQVAETIDLNVPAGLTLGANSTIQLTNKLAEEIFAGKVPASSPYAANTWGALLQLAGWTKVTSSPGTQQFVDDGGATGGGTTISQELRTNGAGATLVFKQYLSYVASQLGNTDWSSTTIDEATEGTNEWPSGATISGRASSDGKQAEAIAATGGLVGYGTLGAALTNGKFASTTGSTGANHLLIADLQNNGTVLTGVKYAVPEILTGTNAGGSNAYTGTAINTSGSYEEGQTGVGNWLVPSTSGAVNTTGVWTGSKSGASAYSHPWDIDVYDDSGTSSAAYPLIIGLWDNTWDSPAWNTGLLKSPDYNAPTTIQGVIKSYLEYATGSTGQGLAYGAHFAPLPTGGTGLKNIQADALKIAEGI